MLRKEEMSYKNCIRLRNLSPKDVKHIHFMGGSTDSLPAKYDVTITFVDDTSISGISLDGCTLYPAFVDFIPNEYLEKLKQEHEAIEKINRENQQHQADVVTQNPSGLYADNVKTIFFNGYKKPVQKSWAGACAWPLHTLFLPISLSAGAAIKTIIDIQSRRPLTANEMQKLKRDLFRLDETEFNDLIASIINYNPQSTRSVDIKNYLASVNAEAYSSPLEKRIQQENVILGYLNNNLNSGTRMEQIIHDDVRSKINLRK